MSDAHIILIADSSPDICALLVDLLTEEGYVPRCCPSEQVTADEIRSASADLVILDLRSDEAGAMLLLLEQLRQHDATHGLPIVISSTNPRLLDDLAAPLRRLRCGTLIKPFDVDQLLRCIAQYLGREQAHQESGCFERAYV